MILHSLTEEKIVGFPPRGAPRAVIPAHAGIQVCSADLAWIPAFAGMTVPDSLLVFIRIPGIFEGRTQDTKI
jgi:hypothetical protein